MHNPTTSSETERTLSRSLLWKALSLAFQPPSEQVLSVFRHTGAEATLLRAAARVEQCEEGAQRSTHEEEPVDLKWRVGRWFATVPSLDLESWGRAQARIFSHTVRGPVCPYEAEYDQDGLFQQPQQLASLNGFYRTFGLRIDRQMRERPDHIGCELEFLEFLCRKLAYARQIEDSSMEEVTASALRLFLKQHLGRFGRAFARQVADLDEDGFSGRAADLLFDMITLECRRLGIAAGPSRLSLQPIAEDNVPMACGGESGLVQLES